MTTTDNAISAMAPGTTSPWAPATTDTTLLQAALEQAGRENQVQAEMIVKQRAALQLTEEILANVKGQLASLQREYQSVSDRFAENWPTNTEQQRLRNWLTQLQGLLTASLEEGRLWRERYYGLYQSYAAGAPAPVAAKPPLPAADSDEMLG